MAFPHIRPVAAPPTASSSDQASKRGRLGFVERESTIIGRRDIAIVPWVTIAMVSVALTVSLALRPDDISETFSDGLIIAATLAYALVAGTIAMLQDHPLAVRARQSLFVYLGGSALLIGALAIVGVLDLGVATVYFAPLVQVAAYLGLVLPRRWAIRILVVLLLTVAGVHLANDAASTLDVVTFGGLVIAAWLVGVLIHQAHGGAAKIALVLSRSDVLTAALNRRGFFDQFDAEITAARAAREPMALLIVDLDEFKRVNDEQGHAAGDELLRWVGRTAIPSVLPATASLGRLGGDEFGIVLPGARRAEADALAAAVHDALAARIESSIGVAFSEDGETTSDDFLRVADAALYACKADPDAHVQSLVAGTARSVAAAPRSGVKAPAMTYQQLRSAGGPPERPAQGVHFGWLLRGSFWVVAASGAMVTAGIAIEGAQNIYGDLVLYMSVPWIAANIALGWIFGNASGSPDRRIMLARVAASILVGLGISFSMLAHGGITSPIIAGLYLKVLFDASVLARRQAAETAAVSIAWWAFAVALSPTDQYWAVPYQLTLFAVSYGLGMVGRNAFMDATSARLRLAHTDALTGLRNRPGFTQGAERAFAAAKVEDRPFAIIAFDLDDFKLVNDTKGHAAGDELLQQVAEITRDTLPSAYSVGRLGGDEFVAAVPAGSVEEAGALATALTAKLTPLVGASIGCAVHPADGDDLESLLRSADHRSYSAKPGRTRHSPLTVAPDDDGIAAA